MVVEEVMLTAVGGLGTTLGTTTLELAGEMQPVLLVTRQLMVSPVESVLLLNFGLSVPAMALFTAHWKEGAEPPLTTAAVSVIVSPAQMVSDLLLMVTETLAVSATVTTILAEVSTSIDPQVVVPV